MLDLKTPGGVAALKRLAASADVFIQNFRPGAIARLGLDAETLCALNPKLVFVSIAGFGFDGPFAAKPVFDPLIESLSGLTTVQAGSDEARPRLVRTILPDKLTGYVCAQAVCAALLARAHRRGPACAPVHARRGHRLPLELGHERLHLHRRLFRARGGAELHRPYLRDRGRPISVAVMRRKEWESLSRAVGRPEWLEDPRLLDSAGLTLTRTRGGDDVGGAARSHDRGMDRAPRGRGLAGALVLTGTK